MSGLSLHRLKSSHPIHLAKTKYKNWLVNCNLMIKHVVSTCQYLVKDISCDNVSRVRRNGLPFTNIEGKSFNDENNQEIGHNLNLKTHISWHSIKKRNWPKMTDYYRPCMQSNSLISLAVGRSKSSRSGTLKTYTPFVSCRFFFSLYKSSKQQKHMR